MNRLLSWFGGVGFVLAAASCMPSPEPVRYAPLTFENLGSVALDVAEIEVVQSYVPPLGDPHVDHLSPTTPSDAVRQWVADHIQPQGQDGRLRVVIEDARIVAVPLPRTTGVMGVFVQDQAERFDGRLEVSLEAYAPRRLGTATVTAVVNRSITVPEDATLAERDDILRTLTQKMVEDVNTQLDASMNRYFAPIRL